MSGRSALVVVQPGEIYFGRATGRLRTLVGSCVTATLWHPARQLAGMCHYLLPERPRDLPADVAAGGRYGDEALLSLSRAVEAAGTRPGEYVVHLFGGGNMFPGARGGPDLRIGERNISVGRENLARLGFTIRSEHVADSVYRMVTLDMQCGEVTVRYRQVALGRAELHV